MPGDGLKPATGDGRLKLCPLLSPTFCTRNFVGACLHCGHLQEFRRTSKSRNYFNQSSPSITRIDPIQSNPSRAENVPLFSSKRRPMLSRKVKIFLMLGGLSAFIGGYTLYFFKVMSSKPELRSAPNSTFGKFISDKCGILGETFSPTWWAGSSLAQTLGATAVRSSITQMRYTRELLNCPDGGVVSLDWFEAAPSDEQNNVATPIAIMFPGLIGDSQSDYLRYIVPAVHKLGYRTVSFNNRGRGGTELRTPRLYCAANFDDLELAVDHIREKNPNSRIIATGFSMGGMVLTRYLAERGANAKVDAAMLVSANYDLVNGTKTMESGVINRLVNRVMTKSLVDVMLGDKEVLSRTDKPVQWDKLREATSFRELDRYFTCPMWGYKDPEDYFRDSTNNDRMPKIRVPTLALNSADDLFSPYETLPLDRLNEAVVFVITQRGGHLGFMDGWLPSAPFYGDRLIEQYHKAILEVESTKDLLRSNANQ